MYVKYVQNTKFVSPNTLPGINFMKTSLVQIYSLDHDVSYNHAFLYIRQLAINLRNAITLKKKVIFKRAIVLFITLGSKILIFSSFFQENFQAIYNWQYINSLRFWTELITTSKDKSILRSLLYPLVQVSIKQTNNINNISLIENYIKLLINTDYYWNNKSHSNGTILSITIPLYRNVNSHF